MEKSGLVAGDLLVKFNGISTLNMPPDRLYGLYALAQGTGIKLEVLYVLHLIFLTVSSHLSASRTMDFAKVQEVCKLYAYVVTLYRCLACPSNHALQETDARVKGGRILWRPAQGRRSFGLLCHSSLSLGSHCCTKRKKSDCYVRAGFLTIKSVLDATGKPAKTRTWREFYCSLRGDILTLHEPIDAKASKVRFGGLRTWLESMLFQEQLAIPERINIRSALCTIVYSHKKRKDVFRIQTLNGAEYMCQANDKTDMLNWIRAIGVRRCYINVDSV